MRSFFFLFRSAFVLLLLAGFAPRTAQASHALGSDLSYTNVSPGVYFVTYRFYRDCSGIAAPSTMQLEYEGTGCGQAGMSSNPGARRALTRSGFQTGNPYCRRQNAASLCDSANQVPSNGLPNYQIFTYGGLVTLGTSVSAMCNEWEMSVSVSVRPNVRNIDDGENLYSSVTMNNQLVSDDSSPAFSIIGGLQPLAVMYENTPVRYNGGVIDPDGDSLAYRMVAPLSAANDPIPYINGHSLAAPIRLMAGSAPLSIDQRGTLTFIPGQAIRNSTDDEDNKFVVVIQAEAWRLIPALGRRVKICSVRRDIAAIIATNTGVANYAPDLGSSVSVTYPTFTQAIAPGDTVFGFVGEPMEVTVPFFDMDGDSVWVEMPAALSPTGSSLTAPVGAPNPGGITQVEARINWTPTATHARSQAHTFFLRVRDNGCPNAASAFYPLAVVIAAQRPLGTARDQAGAAAPSAVPNPFGAATRLRLPGVASAVGIYDLTGRLIEQLLAPTAEELDWHAPAALPAGVYQARYRVAGGGTRSVRLVKQ